MANLLNLQMPPFDPDVDVGASVAPKWRLWVADFQTFLVTDTKHQQAMLCFLSGPQV